MACNMADVSITVSVRGGEEKTLSVAPADVVDSWDEKILPRLASSLGLGGPDDIASVAILDSDGEEDLVDGTRARKRHRKAVASFGESDRLIVAVGQRQKLWLDPSREHDKHGQDMRWVLLRSVLFSVR
jgi:hypothetical protein